MSVRARKKADGTVQGWQARVDGPLVTGADGKPQRTRVEKTFRIKKDAERWERRKKEEFATGGYVAPAVSRRGWGELVAAWRDTKWPMLAPRTTARYGQVLRTYLDREFAGLAVADLDRERVHAYFAGLTSLSVAGEIAPETVRKVHTTMSAVCSHAVASGVLPANPAKGAPLPKGEEPELLHFLSEAEISTLADAMPTASDRLLVLTAAYTGLRASELHALRVRDVDLLHQRLHVRRAIKGWKQGTPSFGATKSGKPRLVPLPPTLAKQLTEHLALLPGGGTDALVFQAQGIGNAEQREKNPDRAIHQVAFLRNHFKPAVKKVLQDRADYEHRRGLRFHDLRHTYASLLIGNGAHLEAVRVLLGHASIVTTQRYAHLAPDVYATLAAGLFSAPAEERAGTA